MILILLVPSWPVSARSHESRFEAFDNSTYISVNENLLIENGTLTINSSDPTPLAGYSNAFAYTLNGGNYSVTNYTISLTLINGTGFNNRTHLFIEPEQADFSDVRVTDGDNNLRPQCYDGLESGVSAKIRFLWTDELTAFSDNTSVVVHWGNALASRYNVPRTVYAFYIFDGLENYYTWTGSGSAYYHNQSDTWGNAIEMDGGGNTYRYYGINNGASYEINVTRGLGVIMESWIKPISSPSYGTWRNYAQHAYSDLYRDWTWDDAIRFHNVWNYDFDTNPNAQDQHMLIDGGSGTGYHVEKPSNFVFGEWSNMTAIADPDGETLEHWHNGTLEGSASWNLSTPLSLIRLDSFMMRTRRGETYLDNLTLRKYLNPEPYLSTGGAVQTSGFMVSTALNEDNQTAIVFNSSSIFTGHLTAEFSSDNSTWTDHEGVAGQHDSIPSGNSALSLRALNWTSIYVRLNLTYGTTEVYEYEMIYLVNGTGTGTGTTQSRGLLLMALVVGIILGLAIIRGQRQS